MALVGAGLARLARAGRSDNACVLTFHGLRQAPGPSAGCLDDSLHVPVDMFRRICHHLSRHYSVIPLSEMMEAVLFGRRLPPRAVAITFDDGYASNATLGLPVLKAFSLPATLFLTSGFVDEAEPLWFQRIDLAITRSSVVEFELTLGGRKHSFSLRSLDGRRRALTVLLRELKHLPDVEMRQAVLAIEEQLGAGPTPREEIPDVLRPLTWEQARALRASGLVEIEAHTCSHPILAHCDGAQVRREIMHCSERIEAELGRAPRLFAYPNGGPGDFNDTTRRALIDAGMTAAFTTAPGFVARNLDAMALPRFGGPESVCQAEATASGAFDLFKALRGRLKHVLHPAQQAPALSLPTS